MLLLSRGRRISRARAQPSRSLAHLHTAKGETTGKRAAVASVTHRFPNLATANPRVSLRPLRGLPRLRTRVYHCRSASQESKDTKNDNSQQTDSNANEKEARNEQPAARQDFDAALRRALSVYSNNKLITSLGIGLGMLVLIFIFWDDCIDFFSEQTADVATRSLEQEAVQQKTKDFLEQLLADPRMLQKASEFSNALLALDSTRDALATLFTRALREESTKEATRQLAQDVTMQVLNDPATQARIVLMLQHVLALPATRDAMNGMLMELAKDPVTKEHLSQMMSSVVASDSVQASSVKLGKHTAHQVNIAVLSDPSVRHHAVETMNHTLNNQELQHGASDALWNALKGAVTPRSWRKGSLPPPSPAAQKSPAAAGKKRKAPVPVSRESSESSSSAATTTEQVSPVASTAADKVEHAESEAVSGSRLSGVS